jgi:hypothetical protein
MNDHEMTGTPCSTLGVSARVIPMTPSTARSMWESEHGRSAQREHVVHLFP